MKSVDFVKALGAAVCVTVACSAYAQDTSAPSAAPAATASPAPAPAPAQSARKADRRLGFAVRRALAKTQGLNVSSIVVRSRGGNVTLTGSVPSQGQIDQAGQVAQGVAGVKSVANKLTVVQQ